MALNRENIDNLIEDDLNARNENWEFLEAHTAESVTEGNPHGIDAKANKEQEPWIEPTLLNGWSDDDTCYMKDEFGFVHLQGQPFGGIKGEVVFVLPVGYRPNRVARYLASTTAKGSVRYVEINTDGDVVLDDHIDNGGTNVNLFGITFKAVI